VPQEAPGLPLFVIVKTCEPTGRPEESVTVIEIVELLVPLAAMLLGLAETVTESGTTLCTSPPVLVLAVEASITLMVHVPTAVPAV
jgi:hypothetical protein